MYRYDGTKARIQGHYAVPTNETIFAMTKAYLQASARHAHRGNTSAGQRAIGAAMYREYESFAIRFTGGFND